MKPVKFLQIDTVGSLKMRDLIPLTRIQFENEGVSFFEITTELPKQEPAKEKPGPQRYHRQVNQRYDFSLDDLLADTVEKFQTNTEIPDTDPAVSQKLESDPDNSGKEKLSIVNLAKESYNGIETEFSVEDAKVGGKPTPPWVLLIEDDSVIAGFLVHLLSRRGFEVQLAEDGRKAARMFDEIPPPNLVILDIMLPFIDGFELIKRIRNKCEWNDVPILMLTSKTQEQDIVRALDDGANDYMVKPFQSRELIARVDQYIS
ncbi:MAG: response regulator transcription factor [Pyrinomonadaceae bacterium]